MKTTFTKKFVTIIMAIALIDIQFPFILAFLGREQIAESMGQILVTEIIGVFFVYCLKSFFETREEKHNELLRGINDENSGNNVEHSISG